MSIYCRLPAGWGLQQTTRTAGSDKIRGQGSFGPFTGGQNLTTQKFKRTDRTLDLFY